MKTMKIRQQIGGQQVVQYFLNVSDQEIARYWQEYCHSHSPMLPAPQNAGRQAA